MWSRSCPLPTYACPRCEREVAVRLRGFAWNISNGWVLFRAETYCEVMRGRTEVLSPAVADGSVTFVPVHGGGEPAPSIGAKRQAGVRLLGPARSPFRIGDFDVLPSAEKRPAARTEERPEV